MTLGMYKEPGLEISRAGVPLQHKACGLPQIPGGWGPSEKVLGFIGSVSAKLDVIQHGEHTAQSRELTPTSFLYFCLQDAVEFVCIFQAIDEMMQRR